MKQRFIPDPNGLSDRFIGADWDEVLASFSPWDGPGPGKPSSNGPVPIPATALTSEAATALSANARGGTPSAVSMTSGGITINLSFDAAAMAAPASFRSGIQQAASILTGALSDKITVNIKIDYSGTGGGAAAGPDNGYYCLLYTSPSPRDS